MPRGHVFPDFRWIAHLRGEAGLTQDDVAELSGFGRRTISKIENGKPTTAPTLSAIATVLSRSLGRDVTLADLVRAPHGQADRNGALQKPAEFVVAQQILSLHLPSVCGCAARRSPTDLAPELSLDEFAEVPAEEPSPDRGKRIVRLQAVLIDTYSLQFFDEGLTEIGFPYATFGSSISGRSLSHPDAGRKRGRRSTPAASRCGCEAGDPVLRLMLSYTHDRPLVVQNEIEYEGAFRQPNEQRFHADVVFPTDSLSMLIHFPGDRRFAALIGRRRHRSSDCWSPVADQPISLSPGRVAYWRIESPAVGERYELSWQ